MWRRYRSSPQFRLCRWVSGALTRLIDPHVEHCAPSQSFPPSRPPPAATSCALQVSRTRRTCLGRGYGLHSVELSRAMEVCRSMFLSRNMELHMRPDNRIVGEVILVRIGLWGKGLTFEQLDRRWEGTSNERVIWKVSLTQTAIYNFKVWGFMHFWYFWHQKDNAKFCLLTNAQSRPFN